MVEAESDDGFNTYDCRICRREKYDIEARICFLRRDWAILQQSEQMLAVDPEIVFALVADTGDDISQAFDGITDSSGRVVCPIACVPSWAHEAVAEEIDAKEYGVHRGEMNRKEIAALRIVRSERARAESERMKRMRSRHG